MINSPQVSSPPNESFHIDFNERINSLNISLTNQLELLPKTSSSLDQLFHSIPILFRFLRKNLQSQQKLFTEYNDLSNTIQQVISICAQYIHDRHDHENELLFLKDKISQIIGQIGYTQHCLEQYWTMIRSLEQEIERLQILLNNSQLLQINRQKFQILQETQKIKLDRIIKENENIKLLINKRKDSIQVIQTQIETDVKELHTLRLILYNNKLEQKDVHNHWSQIEKQTSHLQTIIENTKNMEMEYTDRIKTTKVQYVREQKQLNTLSNTYDETNRRLSSIQTNETNIKQEIENVKNEITTAQTQSLTHRNQIQNLRHETHKLKLSKRHTHHLLKSEEHTNSILERKLLLLEHNQQTLQDRSQNLTGQLTNTINRKQTNEHIISINIHQLKDQQYKITTMKIAIQKIIHLNNNLEKILQENRFIRINEQEKLRSMKQISFQQRKQLITHTRRLHTLSINEHHLINNTIRNSFEIIRLNNIFHDFNNTEKFFQQTLRTKKTELMKYEKQRASLSRSSCDNDNRIHFLTKKNQLIENELQSKIEHVQLLNYNFLKQKHDRIILSNQKQYCIYSYRQKLQNLNELHRKNDQLGKISDHEINHIINKIEENEQLKFSIHNIKQQIITMMSRNKREIDECTLLNEKIRLYTQLNDTINQQQQRYSYQINHFSRHILDLQQENNRLLTNLQNLQKKAMITASSHHNKVRKKDKLNQINQILSHRPLTIRNNPIHGHTHIASTDYSTFVNRLMKMVYQCAQWREKLAWINQLYFKKNEQIHQQTRLLATKNELILRHQIDSDIKQCKAMKAEFRLQILSLSLKDNVSYL